MPMKFYPGPSMKSYCAGWFGRHSFDLLFKFLHESKAISNICQNIQPSAHPLEWPDAANRSPSNTSTLHRETFTSKTHQIKQAREHEDLWRRACLHILQGLPHAPRRNCCLTVAFICEIQATCAKNGSYQFQSISACVGEYFLKHN